MITVKIELWPGGDESRAREIDRVYIANDGTGNQTFGNYGVFLGDEELSERKRNRNGHYAGVKQVRNFNRRQGMLALVERALQGITLTSNFTQREQRRWKRTSQQT